MTQPKVTLDPEAIKKVLPDLDGHSIFKADWLIECGLPEAFVRDLVSTFKSDTSDVKTTLFVNDQPVESLTGVYGLTALIEIADAIGADRSAGSQYFGRGRRASALKEAIRAKLAE